jgi:anaerobic ribonucleoside-triphosphate reductase
MHEFYISLFLENATTEWSDPQGENSCLHNMLTRLDAEQFPGIRSANTEGGKPLYTNPLHRRHGGAPTPTFSICPNHGYLPGRQESCPTCGAVSEVYSRVVGYLRPVNQWNEGKVEEFKQRKTFKIAQGASQAT